jgi:hypothetical protein
MKTFPLCPILITVCSLFIGSLPLAAHSTSARSIVPAANDLSAATLQELARARAATAKYHQIAQAEADGYADINFFESGEGFHWEKGSLIDGVFDPEQPEDLIYAAIPPEKGLKLVMVEYLVPLEFSPDGPPEGFTGDADVWELNEEFGFWEVRAWVWLNNPDGIFAPFNPRLP